MYQNGILLVFGLVADGISTGGMGVVWALVSADPLCKGGAAAGRISGAVNTVIIAIDAIFTPVFGIVLDSLWQGTVDSEGSRRYGKDAYSVGFLICAGVMFVPVLCVLVLHWQMRR